MYEKSYFSVEQGDEICIQTFDSFFEAKLFAEQCDIAKEIFEFKGKFDFATGEMIDSECVGLVWRR